MQATEQSKLHHSTTATLLIRFGNDTVVDQPNTGLSRTKESDKSSLQTILIVVAVLAIIIIVTLIVVFVLYRRSVNKRIVSPRDGRPVTPPTDEENLSHDNRSVTSKELLLNPTMLTTPEGKAGTLPPLQMRDTGIGTDEKKKRSRRRKKNKEQEIFDGTREYDAEVSNEFLDASNKSRIKQSARSKDTKTDPKYWITVPNDELE